MKPKNFPGRKNKRRVRALSRLGKKIAVSGNFAHKKEAMFLQEYIVAPEEARSIRSKKKRGE